jgi:hypothetical protein
MTPDADIVYSPAAQAILAQNAARAAAASKFGRTTRDGNLSCVCGKAGCTCAARRATRDADTHPVVATIMMCCRHLSDRLDKVESQWWGDGNGAYSANGGDDIDARHAQAEAKLETARKEHRIGQIEKLLR